MTRPRLRELREPILIVGAYGYRNVGDEAILAGVLDALGPGRQVTVVSRSPAETEAMHGIAAVSPLAAIGALKRHRSVLVGGGGLFGRDMGRIGQLTGPFTAMAALAGKEVAVAGVGVDPGMPRSALAALRLLARRGLPIGVRDADSAGVLARHGISTEIGEDFSARLRPSSARDASALLRSAGIDPARPVIGLALAAVDPLLAQALPQALAELAAAFPDTQLCLIPMSQHPFVAQHNDLLLARRLKRGVPRLAVVDGLLHPASVLALFGALSVAVCMRYHALRFAEQMGTPIVAVPYAQKCRTWIADRRIPATPLTGAALTAAVSAAMSTRMAVPA